MAIELFRIYGAQMTPRPSLQRRFCGILYSFWVVARYARQSTFVKGMAMELWISHSNPVKQYLLALGSLVIGLIMSIGFYSERSLNGNAMAGFLLGILLTVIGVAGFLATGKQTVAIDARKRRIVIEDTRLFSTTNRFILFGDIADVSIGFLGKRSNYVSFYYLVLKLRDGEEYPLFAPGRFFAGSSDRAVVEGWKKRLQDCMNL